MMEKTLFVCLFSGFSNPSFTVRLIFLYFIKKEKKITISYPCWLCRFLQVEERNWDLFWSVLLMEGLSPSNPGLLSPLIFTSETPEWDNQGSNHVI